MLHFILVLVAYAGAAIPWQTGQLIDASTERVFAGTAQDPGGVFDSRRAQYVAVRSYVIRAGDREYTISEQRSRYSIRDHAPHLVVNTPIRFRVEKRKISFLDEDGKEFKGEIEREAAIKP